VIPLKSCPMQKKIILKRNKNNHYIILYFKHILLSSNYTDNGSDTSYKLMRSSISYRKPLTCRKSLTNLSHNVILSTPHHEQDSNSELVVIDTNCIGSCRSNYHTITITTMMGYHHKF
jgi:hypothetical protein